MTRTSERDIGRTEDEVDLRALLRARGVVLKKFGYRKLAADCPFHAGGDGSLIVDPTTGSFKCGVCGRSGGAAEFLAASERARAFRRHAHVLRSRF